LSANFRWKGLSPLNHCWYQKTRVFLLPHSEDLVILCSFVWIGYQRVTDGRTDGRTDGLTDGRTDRRNCCRYYSALHCMQCGRAVKSSLAVALAKHTDLTYYMLTRLCYYFQETVKSCIQVIVSLTRCPFSPNYASKPGRALRSALPPTIFKPR